MNCNLSSQPSSSLEAVRLISVKPRVARFEDLRSTLALSINQSLRQPTVRINPPIAQKGPVRARDVHLREVNDSQEDFFFVRAGFGEDFPRCARNETLSPKLDTSTTGWTLMANAV